MTPGCRGSARFERVPDTCIVLIRHGHHDPRGRHLQHDCEGLTDLGQQQARALAVRLVSHNLNHREVTEILTSRAARAIETGRLLADLIGIPLASPSCDWCEMHPGEAEGLTVEEMLDKYGPTYADVPGGEYFPIWLPRAVETLRALAAESRGRTVVAVTHSGVVKASFVAFGRMPASTAESVSTANTGITVWTQPVQGRNPRCDVWSLERHNDTAHLDASQL